MNNNSLQDIIRIFTEITNESMMSAFFNEIFTDPEKHDIALRWQLMKKLHEGIPQRRIADELGVSLCKITRGAKIIRDKQSVSNQLLSQSESS